MARPDSLPRPTRFPNLRSEIHVGRFSYDFATHGGAVGAIPLRGVFPAGAMIIGGHLEVITTCTTASADSGTGALHIKNANDIVTATAVSAGSNIWDAGLQKIAPTLATAATLIKLTADSQVIFTIAVAAFTAGRFNGYLQYVMSETYEY